MRFHHLDTDCKDLELLCKFEPKCDDEYVRKKCPKLCGTCKGKTCHIRKSVKPLAKPKYNFT